MDDKIQSNLTSLFKQHFKELTPNPKIVDDTESDHTMLKSKTYKNLASVGRVAVSEGKDTTQEKNAMSNKPIVNSNKREKTKDNHKSNPSKQQNVNKKRDAKKSIDSKGNNNKNPSTTSRTSQQHTLKTSIKKTKTKEGRRSSQDETILTFHPKQAFWNGERTKLQSYIQQWHTQLKGFSDMKAITILQKCIPPPYRNII